MTKDELLDNMVSCYDNGDAMFEYVEEYYAQRSCDNCKYEDDADRECKATITRPINGLANFSCNKWDSEE